MLHRAFMLFLLLFVPVGLAAQEAPKLAKLTVIEEQNGSVTRQFFGQVVAKETVDLAFQVGGQVIKLPVIEGEPIGQGEIVAELDLEPFELALDQAKVQLEQANRTLTRLQQLQGSSVSEVSVQDAETTAQLAEIAVRDAERSLKNATLKAPFDGLVAARQVANFASVSAGTPVARLHDMSDLRVEIDVPEILFQRAGEDPDIELIAKFPASENTYELTPREFNAETSDIGQTFRITLGMAPPDDLVILPGSSVSVFATLREDAPALTIPGSAVVTSNDGSSQVMVFEPAGSEEGTVRAIPVEITPTESGAVQVVSGLEAGMEIVASGANMLSDGDAVKRFTGFAN